MGKGAVGFDFLVLGKRSNDFQDPWQAKSGSLTALRWETLNERQARYRGAKFVPDEDESPDGASSLGEVLDLDERAIRIWPTESSTEAEEANRRHPRHDGRRQY